MTIEERLERLENKLTLLKRRSQWLFLAILLAAGAWIAFAGKTVRANAFILVDEQGYGGFDKKGKVRAWLGTDKDGPRVVLNDEQGYGGASLAVTEDGPGLDLFDAKGKLIWGGP